MARESYMYRQGYRWYVYLGSGSIKYFTADEYKEAQELARDNDTVVEPVI